MTRMYSSTVQFLVAVRSLQHMYCKIFVCTFSFVCTFNSYFELYPQKEGGGADNWLAAREDWPVLSRTQVAEKWGKSEYECRASFASLIAMFFWACAENVDKSRAVDLYFIYNFLL